MPGVVAVGAISDFFIHRQPDYRIAIEGQPPQTPEAPAPPLTEDQVVPGYFEAMRIPVTPRPTVAGERSHAGSPAGGRDQRRNGAAVLAWTGSDRQALQAQASTRRAKNELEDGGRRGFGHEATTPRRSGDSLHVSAWRRIADGHCRARSLNDPNTLRERDSRRQRVLSIR